MKARVALTVFFVLGTVSPGAGAASQDAKVRQLLDKAVKCKRIQPTRCKAVRNLLKEGKSAVASLRKTLNASKSSPKRLSVAITVLSGLRDTASGAAILPHLKHKNGEVRYAAIIAVGLLKPKGAVAALASQLITQNQSEKAALCAALGLTRSPGAAKPLQRALKSPSIQVQVAAVRGLGRLLYKDVITDLKRIQKRKKMAGPVRLALVRAFAETGKQEVIPVLMKHLNDSNPAIVKSAIVGLGRLKAKEAAPQLTDMLKNPKLMSTVLDALGKIKDPRALRGLVRIITERKVTSPILKKTFWVIGQIRAKEAVSTLVRFLKDTDPKIVIWSAGALGEIRDRSAAEPLFNALSRPNKDVQLMVIWALEKISKKRFGNDVKRWEQWVYNRDKLR